MSEFNEANKYETEYEYFIDDFSHTIFDLTSNLQETLLFQKSPLKVLKKILENEEMDLIFYIENKNLLANFLKSAKSYLEISEDEILHSLEKQAEKIVKILLNPNLSKQTKENDVDELLLRSDLKKLAAEYKQVNEKINKISKISNKVYTEYEDATKIISDLKAKNTAYNQYLDEDSNIRILSHYIRIYDSEIKIADRYRNWALGIFAFIGLLLLFGFMNFSIQNWNHLRDSSYIHIPLGWESFIKTLMLFSLTTPAWYLARESSKHRKVAYKAQMLGTELASFPLYVREFKDEDRLELRKQLADRFFGQELYSDVTNSASSDNSLEQIKLLTEANKALTESLKIKKSME